MADWIGGLRWGSPTSQKFWIKNYTSATETPAVFFDNSSVPLVTGSALSSASDYTTVLEADNISSGLHTYSVGSVESGPQTEWIQFTTLPSPGESFDFAFGGDSLGDSLAFLKIADYESPRFFHHGGDIGYLDSDPNDYGGCPDVDTGTLEAYRCHWRRRFDPDRWARGLPGASNEYFLKVQQKYQSIYQYHDHEINNDRVEIGSAGIDTRLDFAIQAASEYALNGFPRPSASTSSEANPNLTDSYPDPLLYWSTSIAGIRLIQMDMITYDYNKLGDGYGTDTGTHNKQAAWVAKEIENATEDLIVLFQPAGWKVSNESGMPAVRDAVIAKTGTTIIGLACDSHLGHVRYIFTNGTTDEEKMLEVFCTPFHQSTVVVGGLGLDSDDPILDDTRTLDRYGMVKYRPTGTTENNFPHVQIEVNSWKGNIWSGVIPLGSRQLVEPGSMGNISG